MRTKAHPQPGRQAGGSGVALDHHPRQPQEVTSSLPHLPARAPSPGWSSLGAIGGLPCPGRASLGRREGARKTGSGKEKKRRRTVWRGGPCVCLPKAKRTTELVMGSELLLPPYLRQLPGRQRMLAGSQRQGRTCCLELGCGQDEVNIPARKLCRGADPALTPPP